MLIKSHRKATLNDGGYILYTYLHFAAVSYKRLYLN